MSVLKKAIRKLEDTLSGFKERVKRISNGELYAMRYRLYNFLIWMP
jgi:hypothetical protein